MKKVKSFIEQIEEGEIMTNQQFKWLPSHDLLACKQCDSTHCGGDNNIIECENCGYTVVGDTSDDAINNWNTRGGVVHYCD